MIGNEEDTDCRGRVTTEEERVLCVDWTQIRLLKSEHRTWQVCTEVPNSSQSTVASPIRVTSVSTTVYICHSFGRLPPCLPAHAAVASKRWLTALWRLGTAMSAAQGAPRIARSSGGLVRYSFAWPASLDSRRPSEHRRGIKHVRRHAARFPWRRQSQQQQQQQ